MSQSYDVILSGTGMGQGEQVLVDNLMKGFIHTLTQRENLPTHIIFMASGVKLLAYGSDALEDLKVLEGKGVKLLACRTCLVYYDLEDDMEVGEITNMKAVTEILTTSNLVVKP